VSSNAVPPVQENFQTAAYGGATVPPNVGAAPVNSQPYGSVQYYAPAYLFHPSAPPPQQVPLFTLPAPLGSYMPVSAAGTVPFPLDFQSGIFDCLEEVESLVVGCCCWQLLAVQTNAHLQGRPQLELQDWAYCLGMTLVNVCVGWPVANYGVTYTNRRTMRQRFGMSTDTVLEDMCLVAFCGVCLECQQAREMKYRSGMLVPPTVGTQMVRQDSMV
jgi:Cys-rich protein (TIGR01571 family)